MGHESQQKFGFKFLVTQLLGYLTGGPQRYTGVSMEAAHKHLAISAGQWESFIADAVLVFQEIGLDPRTQSELLAILAGFKTQCVLQGGEPVPEDPGMCRARPGGNMAYAQLGGVYPLALFARLVDKVLQGDRVQVQWNPLDDVSGSRHPPGLKYMLTELLCHSAGGPELPASRGFDDAKLGIDPNQWAAFLEIVAETATVWPTKHHRELVLKICEKSKAEICFGLEGQETPAVNIAAIPGVDAFVPTGRCPFSGSSGGSCPFSGSSRPPAQVAHCAPEGSGRPLANLSTVVSQANGTVAHLVPLAEVATSTTKVTMAGRILGSALQQKLDKLTEEDPDLCCPVSLMVFSNPVLASDGFIYDQSSLTQLLSNRQVSPMTREVLKQEYRAAQQKLDEVTVFRIQRSQDLLDFATEAAAEQQPLAIAALERMQEYVEVLHVAAAQSLSARAMCLYEQLGHPVPEALYRIVNASP